MKIFSNLRGGKKQLKKALQACEEEVLSLKQELDERNKQLQALDEKHVEEDNIKAEEVKILEEKNSEYTAKIEDLTSKNRELEAANKVGTEERQNLAAKIDELNALCSDYKEQVDNNKKTQSHFTQQSESAQTISSATTMAVTSDKEMQDMIKILKEKNEALEAALVREKKKSQKRMKEASERRARFKEKVQNLTRKLSEDDESDDEPPIESPSDTPKAGNAPKRL